MYLFVRSIRIISKTSVKQCNTYLAIMPNFRRPLPCVFACVKYVQKSVNSCLLDNSVAARFRIQILLATSIQLTYKDDKCNKTHGKFCLYESEAQLSLPPLTSRLWTGETELESLILFCANVSCEFEFSTVTPKYGIAQ